MSCTQTELRLMMASLVVFRGILSHPVLKKLDSVLCSQPGTVEQVSLCGDFAAELFKHTNNFSRFLLELAMEDENLFIKNISRQLPVPPEVETCLRKDLAELQALSLLDSHTLATAIGCSWELPEWGVERLDFMGIYRERVAQLPYKGYGIFAKYHTFVLVDNHLTPVQSPDPTRLTWLEGYEKERQTLVNNTLGLLRGRPAANAILYGDAGTGKSSTVKAVANEFREQGLRLIEIRKEQLRHIPTLMDSLSSNPLKFILFIDDLSFAGDDDNFTALKAMLEGSIAAKAANTVIYATSNRRHLVKESFADRFGDDVHLNDTLEEMTSLSARFGLTITFSRPEKPLYLEIVRKLAREGGVKAADLEVQAEAFAIRHGGRSPRVARQFVDQLRCTEQQ